MLKYGVVFKTACQQDFGCFVQIGCDSRRGVCIGADRNNLSAKLAVTADDVTAGVGLGRTFGKAAGIELDSFFVLNQCFQDFIDDIRIFCIAVVGGFVGAVADDIVHIHRNW